jgi:hypothetical protein
MTVSLFILLVLYLKSINLAVETVLFTVINWPSWSDRPLIMRDVEDEFNFVSSTMILPIALLELFSVLAAKFTVRNKLYVVNTELFSRVDSIEIINSYVSTN